MIKHTIQNQTLVLSHLRGLYWEEMRTVVVTDTHLGKMSATAQIGIDHDLLRLTDLLFEFHPERLLILGDLFQDRYWDENNYFGQWRQQFSELPITLIRGNHDILPVEHYDSFGITVREDLHEGPFLFSHKPFENARPLKTVICGHVHPSVSDAQVPCFYFGARHCILPAFSEISSTTRIEPDHHEAIYLVKQNALHKLS